MKNTYKIYNISERLIYIDSKVYVSAGSSKVCLFEYTWYVSHPKWSYEFTYTSKAKAIARAKEMIDSEIDNIKHNNLKWKATTS